MDFRTDIENYVDMEIATLKALDKDAVNKAINLLLETYDAEKSVYIFGNGGSSATASHYQNDFNKGISEYLEKKFHFQCLNDNVATVLAIANDIGFEEVFRFQLRGHLKQGDIVIALSGSGNSENVIRAVEYALQQGNKVIGMSGYDGGRLKKLSDISLHIPVNNIQIAEDIHMMLDHLMMSIIKQLTIR
ncbi:MAG: SIS domain-containing protein [Eubacterium sp.]|nr:SIS domain-containing protein [Eubacterium sp.]